MSRTPRPLDTFTSPALVKAWQAHPLECEGAAEGGFLARGKPMKSKVLKYPSNENIQRLHDVLLVSSFVLWATLIGFVPLTVWRMLAG
jgi:hypothetical protein